MIEAENFYREVLEKNPGHAVALNNLAVLLTLQGKKLDEALSLINKAIEITGPLGSMLDTRACVYIAQGNAEKAVSDMKECIADTPLLRFACSIKPKPLTWQPKVRRRFDHAKGFESRLDKRYASFSWKSPLSKNYKNKPKNALHRNRANNKSPAQLTCIFLWSNLFERNITMMRICDLMIRFVSTIPKITCKTTPLYLSPKP